MSIEGMLAFGFVAGLLIGVIFARPKTGCILLLTVPLFMVFYIYWWQSQHPENLRSTSGLDFLFGPLWPSIGAIGGFCAGIFLRSLFQKRI